MSSAWERLGLLTDLEPVAAVRPDEMLRFARAAAAGGLGSEPQEEGSLPIKLEWLQAALTRITQVAMLEPRLAGIACDVLWAMAKSGTEDPTDQRESPEKAIRDAGKRDAYRLPEFYEVFVAWCERQMAGTEVPARRLARYLGGLLDKETDDHWVSGRKFVLTTRLLNPVAVLPTMHRALQALRAIALGSDIVACARAVDEIGRGVAEPRGRGEVQEELLAAWEPFQLEALAVLRETHLRHDSPITGMLVLAEVRWASRHSSRAPVRAAAKILADEIRKRIAGTLEFAVAPAHVVLWPGESDDQSAHIEEIERIAMRLAGERASEAELLKGVVSACVALEEAGIRSTAHTLTYYLTKARPLLLEAIADGLGDDSRGLIGSSIEPAVSATLDANRAGVPGILDRVMLSRNEVAMRSVASGFRNKAWLAIPPDDQKRVLGTCTSSPDPLLRQIATETLGMGHGVRPEVRAEVLGTLEPGEDEPAQETWSVAVLYGFDSLDPGPRRRLAGKMARFERFGYWTRELLARLGRDDPGAVVDMLLMRLDGFAEAGPVAALRASPIYGDNAQEMWAGLRTSERLRALRGIAERLVWDDVAVRLAAESLFSQVGSGEPQVVREMRSDWVEEGTLTSLTKAAASFSHDDEITLVEEEVVVVGILSKAAELGRESFEAVRSRLHAGGSPQAAWVDPDGPSAEERRLLDGADALVAKYGEGTDIGRFYRELADRSRTLIAHRTRHLQEGDIKG